MYNNAEFNKKYCTDSIYYLLKKLAFIGNISFQTSETNATTRLWAEKGSRPLAVKQQQFEYAIYLAQSVSQMEHQKQWLYHM